ncbi:HTH-type transcriptional regulator YesS [compost metagenome]
MVVPPRDTQLSLLWTARIDYTAGSYVDEHSHENYHQLLIILNGAGTLTSSTGSVPIKQECYYFLRPHTKHRFVFSHDTITLDYKFVCMDRKLDEWLQKLPWTGPCPMSELHGMKSVFHLALQHERNPLPHLPALIDASFKSACIALMANNPNDDSFTRDLDPETSFEPAQIMHQHYAKPIELKDLAKQFNYHPHYLIELFHRHTGLSPMQYLQQVRLKHAQRLLEFTSLSIEDVADRVGLRMPYFSKLFRLRKGLSPSHYRDQVKNARGKDITLNDEFQNIWRVQWQKKESP